MSVTDAVARRADTPTIAQVIAKMRPEIARALPAHMSADRMARIALTVVRQNPKLAKCDPASFAGALLTAAALGLEPGVSGEAYLVPYEIRKGPLAGTVECQLIVGYQGLAKLFWQSPLAQHLDAQAVYENDDFDYAYGLAPMLRHKPALGNRGRPVAYYAVATLSTGGSAFVVLSAEEVKALRGGKVGPSGDIPDPQHWMEKKSVLRQLVKMLPRSASLSHALAADERTGRELAADRVPEQITDGTVDAATGEVLDAEQVPDDPWAPGEPTP